MSEIANTADASVPVDSLHNVQLLGSEINLLIGKLSEGRGVKPTSTMALIGRLHTAKSVAVKAKGTRKPKAAKADKPKTNGKKPAAAAAALG